MDPRAASRRRAGRRPRRLLAGILRPVPSRLPRPFVTLRYAAGGQERAVSVDSEMFLGDLAGLADKLSGRYQWRSAGAVMFVLTGEVAEFFVCTGSASVRGGALAATSTVTMTLDPALTPEQVAGIYARLRARIHPARSPGRCRSSTTGSPSTPARTSVSACTSRQPSPDQDAGPGPTRTGLVRTITSVIGWTWTSLRHAWNDQYGTHGKMWRYDASPNFIRDAKHALARLLAPGWQWQASTQVGRLNFRPCRKLVQRLHAELATVRGCHRQRPKPTVCKTVGSAYVGSNPTPATTCEDGPLAANSRAGGPFPSCRVVYHLVALRAVISRCPRTHSGPASGPLGRSVSTVRTVGMHRRRFHGRPRTGRDHGVVLA